MLAHRAELWDNASLADFRAVREHHFVIFHCLLLIRATDFVKREGLLVV